MNLPPTCVEQFWLAELEFMPRDFHLQQDWSFSPHVSGCHDTSTAPRNPAGLQGGACRSAMSTGLCSGLLNDLFDLFGPICRNQNTKKPSDLTMLLASRFQHGFLPGDLLETFQNFARVSMTRQWNECPSGYVCDPADRSLGI